MEELERIFYQSKPFLLLGLGVYVISSQQPSKIGVAFALVAMFVAAFILRMRLKARNDADVEGVFYEAQPYAYLALSLYAIFGVQNSKIALGLGIMLLFCATMIIRWRAQNRHKQK
ncbi:MAG TPA: hypothetical protein VM432_08130 [Bdellovibrionales bacterium]|nr:hypothetical protein [Bdellovibrionales bacterium]